MISKRMSSSRVVEWHLAQSEGKTRLFIRFFNSVFVVVFFETMYHKTILRSGFCDIRKYQGLGKCYKPQSLALADNIDLDLEHSGYHNNLTQQLFIICWFLKQKRKCITMYNSQSDYELEISMM